MESLNLNTLASSLPTANLQNAEKDLLNNFKAAALSITTLYRSSRHTSKRAYNAGYGAACQDLLMMIQQGVSVGDIGPAPSGSHLEGGGMTIGKIMDWIEARLEAIKAREEEEDEDEEKEKERPAPASGTAPGKSDGAGAPKVPIPGSSASGSANLSRRRDQAATRNPPANASHSQSNTQPASQPPSPSPPPSVALRSIYPPNLPQRTKARVNSAHISDRSTAHPPSNILLTPQAVSIPHASFTFSPSNAPPLPVPTTNVSTHPFPITDLAAGAKRRHAVMMMLDSTSPAVSIAPTSPGATSPNHPPSGGHTTSNHHGTAGTGGGRRRTRSGRGSHHQNIAVAQSVEAMDVEEDGGRERKRVTRR